jgi:endo-1,4-beta-mannosidase
MAARWSRRKAWEWYTAQPWIVGCNFIPSTAGNQIEMWQEESFDIETIGRELGWARGLGFNTIRVYLHDLVWQADPEGFRDRMGLFLDLAARNRIRMIFVFFDDCWNQEPNLGRQPAPRPGVHNSIWVQSPGTRVVKDPSSWGRLSDYVIDIIGSFRTDDRVLLWDLYNEPGNNKLGEASQGLLRSVFTWAREAGPTQPLSAGIWFNNSVMNEFQLSVSDIVTFHNYHDAENLTGQIRSLGENGRPLICTEYMARSRGSRFETHLPIFKRERVGCLNWGLVSHRTQTIYPWWSTAGSPEPKEWFHDIFRRDGTPFNAEEVSFIKKIIAKDPQ